MSAIHRRQDVQDVLTDLRQLAKKVIDDLSAVKLRMAQLELWSGIGKEDFPPDPNDPDGDAKATARRDEALAAVAATQEVLKCLATQVPNFDLTVEQAILRIAGTK